MNKIIVITVIIIIIILLIVSYLTIVNNEVKSNVLLLSPLSQILKRSEPTSTPTPRVKQFKFDSSTNLERVLESVNPEVRPEDFEELINLTSSIKSP